MKGLTLTEPDDPHEPQPELPPEIIEQLEQTDDPQEHILILMEHFAADANDMRQAAEAVQLYLISRGIQVSLSHIINDGLYCSMLCLSKREGESIGERCNVCLRKRNGDSSRCGAFCSPLLCDKLDAKYFLKRESLTCHNRIRFFVGCVDEL